ncbi:MAG: glycolate oxidase subunit GlcE [Beijerinckiaceae bacterium]|nr:glycolate oxidase subunit GlcE [Beijerinckiaceae bacterium]
MIVVRRPQDEEELASLVREASGHGAPLAIEGGGTRKGLGRPVNAGITVSVGGLTGITLYEPAEMVIGARAGTPLALIEAALAEKGQMLGFEPPDFRRLYGTEGAPTIGTVAAGNLSGSRRLWGGACRDSLIGVRFVNGLGEIVKSGGRVMKNVTGLDLVKLQSGAWGTLGVLTEVIFKVVPRPEVTQTLLLEGLSEARAIEAMSAAVGSPFEITGAAHLPAQAGAPAQTLLRIEGFAFSVEYRAEALAGLLKPFGALGRLDGPTAAALWRDVSDGALLAEPRDRALWRLSVKPGEAAAAVAAIRTTREASAFYDWAGGLVWLATPETGDAGAAVIRRAARQASGYATLLRASDGLRAEVPVFEPEPAPIAALNRRIKTSFDPEGLLNPGKMHSGV